MKMPLCVDIHVYHRGMDDEFSLNTLGDTYEVSFLNSFISA